MMTMTLYPSTAVFLHCSTGTASATSISTSLYFDSLSTGFIKF